MKVYISIYMKNRKFKTAETIKLNLKREERRKEFVS